MYLLPELQWEGSSGVPIYPELAKLGRIFIFIDLLHYRQIGSETQVNLKPRRKLNLPVSSNSGAVEGTVIIQIFVKSTTGLNKSFSAGEIRLQTQRPSKKFLQPSAGQANLDLERLTISSVSVQKTVIKPIKDYLLRSSTIPYALSLIFGFILAGFRLSFDIDITGRSSKILSCFNKIFILVLPVLLVLSDDLVLYYVKTLFG